VAINLGGNGSWVAIDGGILMGGNCPQIQIHGEQDRPSVQ